MGSLGGKYRKAIVTGASSGLGLAFTKMLLSEEVVVVGLSRKPQIESASGEYIPIECDLSDSILLGSTLDHLFRQHEDVDLVVNNAGFGKLAGLAELSDQELTDQFNVMLVAPALVARRALKAFASQEKRGCLVNVTSLASELPIPLMPIYNASKAGLSALSDSLYLDAGESEGSPLVIDFRPGDFCTEFADRMKGSCIWNEVDLREVMDRHHAEAPRPDVAVRAFREALLRGQSGRVRVGDFFQAKVAPLGPRFLPYSWLARIIRWYYSR